MILRMLIVEDNPGQREHIGRSVRRIEPDRLKERGIYGIEVSSSGSADEARKLISAGLAMQRPFDIMLADLSLPKSINRPSEDIEAGLDLIDYAQRIDAAREIIVISAFSGHEWISKAIRAGAVDFIAKPYKARELQARVLKSMDRILSKESARVLNQRLRRLVPWAEKGIAYRFTSCFSRFIQSVSKIDEQIQEVVARRSSSVPDDPLTAALDALSAATRDAREEWKQLLEAFDQAADTPRFTPIQEVLDRVRSWLEPCLVLKQVGLTTSVTPDATVLEFGNEVEIVLAELIAGGLNDVPNSPYQHHFEITDELRSDHVEVNVKDNLSPISEHASKSINEGLGVLPDERFDRVWGLSVAQHLALRGGGRLEVLPKADGNVIKYRIPRADHANGFGGRQLTA